MLEVLFKVSPNFSVKVKLWSDHCLKIQNFSKSQLSVEMVCSANQEQVILLLSNQDQVISFSIERKLIRNTLFLDQSAFSNFPLYVIREVIGLNISSNYQILLRIFYPVISQLEQGKLKVPLHTSVISKIVNQWWNYWVCLIFNAKSVLLQCLQLLCYGLTGYWGIK